MKPTLFLAASALILAAPAFAQGGPGGPGARLGELLKEADTNKDGALSKAELTASREAQYARVDTDKDGFVSEAERAAAAPPAAAGRSRGRELAGGAAARFDSNGDGKVSKAEFLGAPTPGFDFADTNKDGNLSKEEIAAVRGRAGKLRKGANQP